MADQLPKAPDQFDRELDFSWIWKFLGAIGLTAVVMFVAMWFMSDFFDKRLADAQPEGSPLLEVGQTTVPPLPHLQVESYTDWAEMRAVQDHENATYGWEDRETGRVRVPVDQAMAEIATHGLPEFAPTGDGTLEGDASR
jgi:hypothetical protein